MRLLSRIDSTLDAMDYKPKHESGIINLSISLTIFLSLILTFISISIYY
jgi:hypothetical protein